MTGDQLDLFSASKLPPERTVRVHFDGGTPCNVPPNYGIGYGSYCFDDGPVVRVDHGIPCSCNAAELLTLSAALEQLALQGDPARTAVHIWGDSKIAIKWTKVAAGEPQRRKAAVSKGASPLFVESIQRLAAAIAPFSQVTAEWKPRAHAVAAFGH
jgi:ribonuclease HI